MVCIEKESGIEREREREREKERERRRCKIFDGESDDGKFKICCWSCVEKIIICQWLKIMFLTRLKRVR